MKYPSAHLSSRYQQSKMGSRGAETSYPSSQVRSHVRPTGKSGSTHRSRQGAHVRPTSSNAGRARGSGSGNSCSKVYRGKEKERSESSKSLGLPAGARHSTPVRNESSRASAEGKKKPGSKMGEMVSALINYCWARAPNFTSNYCALAAKAGRVRKGTWNFRRRCHDGSKQGGSAGSTSEARVASSTTQGKGGREKKGRHASILFFLLCIKLIRACAGVDWWKKR